MAFGFMNTRRYTLTYLFLGSLFMNCISIYWTMWSVLTMSTFMLMLTDFMFFGVRASRVRAVPRCLGRANPRESERLC